MDATSEKVLCTDWPSGSKKCLIKCLLTISVEIYCWDLMSVSKIWPALPVSTHIYLKKLTNNIKSQYLFNRSFVMKKPFLVHQWSKMHQWNLQNNSLKFYWLQLQVSPSITKSLNEVNYTTNIYSIHWITYWQLQWKEFMTNVSNQWIGILECVKKLSN